jgi:hypothetical protein
VDHPFALRPRIHAVDTSTFETARSDRSRVDVVCRVVAIISAVVTIVAVVVAVSVR